MRALIVILLVVGALVGGILTLLSTRNAGMPDKNVLERARKRERAQSDKDDAESDDR
jgi:hypothetical protein